MTTRVRSSGLKDALAHAGFKNVAAASEAIHIDASKLGRIFNGATAPNDPELGPVADAFGIPLEDLQALSRHTPMPPGHVLRIQTLRDKRLRGETVMARRGTRDTRGAHRKTGRPRRRPKGIKETQPRYTAGQGSRGGKGRRGGVILSSVEISPGRSLTRLNGNHPRTAERENDWDDRLVEAPQRGPKRGASYNKLRRTDHALRQATRSLIMSLNVAAMHGHDAIPALPTEILSLVMQDYLQRLGITATMLLDPKFAHHFDK